MTYDVTRDLAVQNRPAYISDANKITPAEAAAKALEALESDPFSPTVDQKLAAVQIDHAVRDSEAKATNDLARELKRLTALAEIDNAIPLPPTPANEQEHEDRLIAARDKARSMGLELYLIPSAPLPIALGPEGMAVERPGVQIAYPGDPGGVLARGRVMECEHFLLREERRRASEKQLQEARDKYREQQEAEQAEAMRQRAIMANAPQIIADLQQQIADLRAELAAKS